MQTDYFSQRSAKHNSQSTKNLDQQYRVTKTNAAVIYSVPCMNCENLIPINEIDQHTMKCLSVSKSVTAVLKSNRILDEINFKISKLRDSIQQLNSKEQKQENSKYLIRADEMCEQIQTIQNTNQIELRKLQDLNQELRTMTESYRGSLAIALYLERLHSLGLQKQTQLEKEIRTPRVDINKFNNNQMNSKQQSNNINNKQISNNYNSQSQSSTYLFQQSSEQSRGSQLPSEQNRNSQLPPPSSQFQNSPYGRPTIITKFSGSQDRNQLYDMKSEILTKISTSQLDESEANQNDNDFNNSNQYNQQQRIFYSKCLAQKTKLPNTHPSQKIPLCILHKEMIQRKIPNSLWDKFIIDALNNPHQYLDMNKVQNTQGLKNQLRSMTQEHQFKQRIHNI
ncbi:unnamed protein product [Paramecium pentaurelia]|uniref:Uncharacterized protein n=1 Tax=Paramecium pentaurelia TaxID=43138 RepID=A0A8S1X6P4_9CILI|nr:unnamed protein product [Paramecium pentaurelia]